MSLRFQAPTLFDAGVSSVKVDTSVKVAELKPAARIACHSSVHTVDHLGEMVRDVSGKNIQLRRTKCAALTRHVIGRAMQEKLLKDIGESTYSLLIDESTDVCTIKQMCVVIRYASMTERRMVMTSL